MAHQTVLGNFSQTVGFFYDLKLNCLHVVCRRYWDCTDLPSTFDSNFSHTAYYYLTFAPYRNFGFVNPHAVRAGKEGGECRGEEHEIVLIWSVNSGKTRVYWNGGDISGYFTKVKRYEQVLLRWESRSGAKFNLVANSTLPESGPQYTIFVDKQRFDTFPHLSELRGFSANIDNDENELGSLRPETEEPQEGSMYFELPPELKEPVQDPNLDKRLELGGFSPAQSPKPTVDDKAVSKRIFSFGGDALEDELTSDFRTNNIESLRNSVTKSIPGTEDMVSRAIVEAFSDDRGSSSSCTSFSSFESLMHAPIDYEAERLKDTSDWMQQHVDYVSSPGADEQKRSFFQVQINTIFQFARQGQLQHDSALSILVNVATLLGLPDIPPAPNDTLLLDGFEEKVTVGTLINAMCEYGEVKEASISSTGRFGKCNRAGLAYIFLILRIRSDLCLASLPTTGICRFVSEDGLVRALAAATRGSLLVDGIKPVASKLGQGLSRRPDMISRRTKSEPSCAIPKPPLRRRASHQRNSVIIGPSGMGQSPFFNLLTEDDDGECGPRLVTPDSSRSTLKPNDFTIIPATASPTVYDSTILGHEITLLSPSMTVRE